MRENRTVHALRQVYFDGGVVERESCSSRKHETTPWTARWQTVVLTKGGDCLYAGRLCVVKLMGIMGQT